MNEKVMQDTFYKHTGYFKNAIQFREALLRKGKDISKKEIQSWLDKQAVYQIFKPKPKYVRVPRFRVSKPNDVHQADLLFLPHDEVCTKTGKNCKTYKYTLSIVDIASRFKAAVPLQSKNTNEVVEAFKSIYNDKKNPLVWPRILQVDAGSEFKGLVSKLMSEYKVKFRRGEAGNHDAQAIVESFNRALAKHIFPYQYAQEMKMFKIFGRDAEQTSDGRNREWVKFLPSIITKLNEQKTSLINMAPKQAIQKSNIEVLMPKYKLPVSPKEEVIDLESIVRYLYEPGELEGGDRKRATDPIWSIHPFRIDRVMEIPEQPVLYFLSEYQNNKKPPTRSFVREELQIIPKDFELPI